MSLADRVVSGKRYGDSRLLNGLLLSPCWKALQNGLFQKNHSIFQFWFLLAKDVALFISELQALSIRLLFRSKFGTGALGFIVIICMIWWMVLLNHDYSIQSLKALVKAIGLAFWGIVSLDPVPWKAIGKDLWQPKSVWMSYHVIVVGTLGTVQYMGRLVSKKHWTDKDNPMQKGNSILVTSFGDYLPFGKDYMHVLWEPSIVALGSLVMYFQFEDVRYATYLALCAGSLFIQESRDYLAKKALKD